MDDDERDRRPHGAVGKRRLAAEPLRQNHDQREGDERRQAEPEVEAEQDQCDRHHREHRGHDGAQPGRQQLLERVDVRREAGDDPARGVALVKGQAQRLQVVEEPQAEVEQDVLPDPPGKAEKGPVGDGGDRHHAAEDDDQRQQPVQVAGPARPDALVDGEADQVGDGERRRGLEQDQGGGAQDRPPVGPDQLAEQAAHARPEDAGQVRGDGLHVLAGDTAPGVDADRAHDATSSACCASRAR